MGAPTLDAPMITIISMLTQDHARLLARLDRYTVGATGARAAERGHDDLATLLREHLHFEEQNLYPLLMLHVDASTMGARANAQHREIEARFAAFAKAAEDDAARPAAAAALATVLRRHFAEEEALILPRLRRMMTDGMLRELGARYRAVRTADVDGASLAR